MRISEAAQAVGCTRRAIKYYEEQGLLPVVDREENGYRDYSDEDIRILHEIQAYRKLGISIDDIRRLLKGGGQDVLDAVLLRKRQEQQAGQLQKRVEIQKRYYAEFQKTLKPAQILKAMFPQRARQQQGRQQNQSGFRRGGFGGPGGPGGFGGPGDF